MQSFGSFDGLLGCYNLVAGSGIGFVFHDVQGHPICGGPLLIKEARACEAYSYRLLLSWLTRTFFHSTVFVVNGTRKALKFKLNKNLALPFVPFAVA